MKCQLTKWLKHGWLTDEPKKMGDRYNWQKKPKQQFCVRLGWMFVIIKTISKREREWLRTLEGVVTQLSRCKIELGAHIPPIVFFYPGVSRVFCVATLFGREATRLRVAPFAPSHPFLALCLYTCTHFKHIYTPLNGSGVLYRMSKESWYTFDSLPSFYRSVLLLLYVIHACCCILYVISERWRINRETVLLLHLWLHPLPPKMEHYRRINKHIIQTLKTPSISRS